MFITFTLEDNARGKRHYSLEGSFTASRLSKPSSHTSLGGVAPRMGAAPGQGWYLAQGQGQRQGQGQG